MDIAFFIPSLNSKGGAEIYLTKIAKLLSKKNDVKIYTMTYKKNVFPEIEGLVNELGLPYIAKKVHGLKVSTIITIESVKKIGKKIPKHELYNFHIFPSNLIKNKHPFVWTAQEPPRMLYDLENEIKKELNPFQKLIANVYFPLLRIYDKYKTHKNVDYIIANSNYSKEYIKKIYKKPIEVIYPGVDRKFFRVKNHKKENTLLSVSRLYNSKRIDIIIKVMKYLEDYKLKIIGTGPAKNKLKKLVKNLRLDNKVEFLGEVNEEILIEEYSKAKYTLYFPIREMYGMVPMESIASGTPVIAINEGGFTETVNGGAILTCACPKKIANIIKGIDNNKYKKLRLDGKKIAKKYVWENTAKKTEELFKKILDNI